MSGYDEKFKQRAVALKYDTDQNLAPMIVASGMGHTAEKIIEVAAKNGIPVFEDTSLATLLSRLELGAEVPQELYKAIVDIYVYFLKFSPNYTKKVEQADEPEEEKYDEEIQKEL